jgi:hypothetical protein
MLRRHPLRTFAAAGMIALGAGAFAAAAPGAAHAQSLPPTATKIVPDLREVGAGSLRWFGLHVYDARLFAAGERVRSDGPVALALRYARTFDGTKIAERSADEIEKLGFGSPADRERWERAMRELFPTVKPGDELAGLHLPGRGAQFFHNGNPIGEIADPEFGRAFFGIWLDPRTSARDLRAQLLGEKR